MSTFDVKPIIPTSPVQSSSTGGLNAVLQALTRGQAVNLQVLKVLNAQTVSFQGNFGSITLHFSDTSQFNPGSKWALQTTPESHELVLKPQVTEKGLEQNARFEVKHTQNIQSTAISSLPNKSSLTVQPTLVNNTQQPGRLTENIAPENIIKTHRSDAAIKQNSLAGVFSGLSQLIRGHHQPNLSGGDGNALKALAKQILNFRITPEVTGQTLKQAVHQSGLFQEALSLKTNGNAPPSTLKLFEGALPGKNAEKFTDLKSQLLSLRSLLVKSGIKPHAPFHQSSTQAPPLPERDGPIQGQRSIQTYAIDEKSNTVFSKLLDQVVEGLARIKLLQLATLPQQDGEGYQSADKAKVQYNMELPLALSGDQTAVIGLRITKDGGHPEHDHAGHGRGWSIDMAMDTEETGPVDAHIHLTVNGLRVVVWAGDQPFADQLLRSEEHLRAGLADEGLDIDELQIFHGRRPDLSRYLPHHGAGYFLDNSL